MKTYTKEFHDRIVELYSDNPLVMELLEIATNLDKVLWLEKMSAAAVDDEGFTY